jgi:sn-glycerol 3-phosphate transport system ATP-binding protein
MNLIPGERGGKPVTLGIRPEHLEPCAEKDATLIVEIDLVEPLGADTLVYGRLEGKNDSRVAARMAATMDARTGKLPLRYDPARAHYFDPETGTRLER